MTLIFIWLFMRSIAWQTYKIIVIFFSFVGINEQIVNGVYVWRKVVVIFG